MNFIGYVAYALMELLHLSGGIKYVKLLVFALLTSTIVMAHYTFYNMSKFAQQGIHIVLKF